MTSPIRSELFLYDSSGLAMAAKLKHYRRTGIDQANDTLNALLPYKSKYAVGDDNGQNVNRHGTAWLLRFCH